MRWPVGFGVAALLCGAVLADDARPLRVEAATLVQAAAKEASAPQRLKLLEQARGKLLEIRNRYPSESAKFQLYVGGNRTTVSPERLDATILELRLAGLDTAKIREVLGRELSATAVDEDGWTDLHYAAALNRPDLVGLLLDSGAKIDARDLGDTDSVSDRLREFLTTLTPNAEYLGRLEYAPLHIAAMVNAVDATKLLIERGADIHTKNIYGWTPLHEAAYWKNYADVVSLLIERGADVHARDDSGGTPLHFAAEGNAVDTVKVLIERGADVHAQDNSGGTPLHSAANSSLASGTAVVASVLIEHGADVHAENKSGETPLQSAERGNR